MRLDLLINHYKEDLTVLGRLLKSIAIQEIPEWVEMGIIICGDGSPVEVTDKFLDEYELNIRYINMPHRGVCATRNTLLDLSEADYIMFCDADDCFSNQDGLSDLIKAVSDSDADIVGSSYLVEVKTDFGFRYDLIRGDVLRIHSKIFRREYLVSNNIRYPDEMEISGDMYFIWLAYHFTDKIVWIDKCFYIWKWNESSVTRSNKFHGVSIYDHIIKCYTLLIKNLDDRSRFDLSDIVIMNIIVMAYIDDNSSYIKDAPENYQAIARDAIKKLVKEYRERYDKISVVEKNKAYGSTLAFKHLDSLDSGFFGINEWLDRYENE